MFSTLLPAIGYMALLAAPSANDCDAILKDGVMEKLDRVDDTRLKYAQAWHFSQLSESQARKLLDGKGTVPIGGIPFSNEMSSESFKSAKSQLSESLTIDLDYSSFHAIARSFGDRTIVNAWSACMADRGGLELYFTEIKATEAVLVLKWRATRDSFHGTIGGYDLGSGVTIAGETSRKMLERGRQLKHLDEVQVKIGTDEAKTPISITIEVNEVTRVITVPPRLKPAYEQQDIPKCAEDALRRRGHTKGENCIRDLSSGANTRKVNTVEYEVNLGPEQVKARWKIDLDSVAVNHRTVDNGQGNWGFCSSGLAGKDADSFTYYLTAHSRAGRTQSVECVSEGVKARITRLDWIAQDAVGQ